MACAAEKRVEDSVSSEAVGVCGDDYFAVHLAVIPEKAFGEFSWDKGCARSGFLGYPYNEICGKEHRHSSAQDAQDGTKNGDEKEQTETTYKAEKVLPFGNRGALDELLYQYCIGIKPKRRLLVTSSPKYRVAAEKDHNISMIDSMEFCVLYFVFIRKFQAAQNCSTRKMRSGLSEHLKQVTVADSVLGVECKKEGSCNNLLLANFCARRLKKDAKDNKSEIFSGSEAQHDMHEEYRMETSNDLPELGVNTSDDLPEPGVKTSNDLSEFDVCDTEMIEKVQTKTLRYTKKSKKPGAVNKENEKKEKMRFSEPVHVTNDNCNYNLTLCQLTKWWIYLILLTKMCLEVQGAVIKDTAESCYVSESEGRSIQDMNKETVCHVPYLTSSTCEAPADATCPTSDRRFDLLANVHCKYRCNVGENLVCLNSDDGMRFVCLPNDISCPEGLGWRISSNKSNGYVEIIVGQCQVGYQETPSRCYDACKDEHFPPDHIPDWLKLYREGDSSHPQLFMCDFTTGYFNPENKSFIKADSQFQFNIDDFCVNGPNPCSDGQMPLHNGTCVNHCQDGFERDAPDFICKQKNDKRNGSIVTVTSTLPPALTTPVPYDPPYDVPDNKTVASTDKTENITNEVDGEETTFEKLLPYVIGMATGGVLSPFIFFVVRYLYRRTKKMKQKVPYPECMYAPRKVQTKTEYGNTNLNIGDGATVHFYSDRKKTVPDMSDSSDETLLKYVVAVSGPSDGVEESREVSGLLSEPSSRV
ncbi:uncharacterized protein LOC123522882 isoform X2 [Mercenaria mercenaria]|nr:uncharacterized protein LOC123522882 isoform X2 [Mercenaria mercenaria]